MKSDESHNKEALMTPCRSSYITLHFLRILIDVAEFFMLILRIVDEVFCQMLFEWSRFWNSHMMSPSSLYERAMHHPPSVSGFNAPFIAALTVAVIRLH
jgi:hypothetical protein